MNDKMKGEEFMLSKKSGEGEEFRQQWRGKISICAVN
jgi:hypothetical protein